MSITDAILNVDLVSVCVIIPVVLLLVHFVPYFVDPHCIRSNGITGPFWAQFSDAWLGWVVGQGHRSEVVHELHEKYGEWRYINLIIFALFLGTMAGSWELSSAEVLRATEHLLFGVLVY